MSFVSIQIDTTTQDYVNLNGQIANTNSLQCRMYQLLKTQRSKWLYAPTAAYGSELSSLEGRRGIVNKTQLTQIILSGLESLTVSKDLVITNIEIPTITFGSASINIYGIDNEGQGVHFVLPPLL